MRTILVTGSDTGIGKTRVAGALARLLTDRGGLVQVVKVVESGVAPGALGDAQAAQKVGGSPVQAYTLASFAAPLAPAAAAFAAGEELDMDDLLARAEALPNSEWRIYEGAGGIASPIDSKGRDWADFAQGAGVDLMVLVIPDRLGAINQARLAALRAAQAGIPFGLWLNAVQPVSEEVRSSTRSGIKTAGIEVWAEQGWDQALPDKKEGVVAAMDRLEAASIAASDSAQQAVGKRCREALSEREAKNQMRTLRVRDTVPAHLNLADNDYLDLSRDPAVTRAASDGVLREGASSSASALVTGWKTVHANLVEQLATWHGFSCGLLWTSGYAANSAVLGTLPAKGDVVLADRLIHHSMIAGLLKSGARIRRYRHLDLDQLEEWLKGIDSSQSLGGATWVVTESVFSMDGDYPDLSRMAELKKRFGFCWVVDEAHALGWYGPQGSGLVNQAQVAGAVDILVGTLGKTLASGGAYTLFHDQALRDCLVNFAGEFIYSTALPPPNAVAAAAALSRVKALSKDQGHWQASSRKFREALRSDGWSVPQGDSPIVPLALGNEETAVLLSEALAKEGIVAAAIRPPTVPAGTSRLRFSLKRTLGAPDFERIRTALKQGRVLQ